MTKKLFFSTQVAVFFNEVVKFGASLLLFFIITGDFRKLVVAANKKLWKCLWIFRCLRLLRHHFLTNFLDTLKVGVPAFIYVVQNFLLYVVKILQIIFFCVKILMNFCVLGRREFGRRNLHGHQFSIFGSLIFCWIVNQSINLFILPTISGDLSAEDPHHRDVHRADAEAKAVHPAVGRIGHSDRRCRHCAICEWIGSDRFLWLINQSNIDQPLIKKES